MTTVTYLRLKNLDTYITYDELNQLLLEIGHCLPEDIRQIQTALSSYPSNWPCYSHLVKSVSARKKILSYLYPDVQLFKQQKKKIQKEALSSFFYRILTSPFCFEQPSEKQNYLYDLNSQEGVVRKADSNPREFNAYDSQQPESQNYLFEHKKKQTKSKEM